MTDKTPPTVIHELKAGLTPQPPDAPQPAVDAVTKELYEQLAPSIVKVKVDGGNGSGFIISKDGDVVTDAHVVLGNRHFSVVTADGVEHKVRMTKLDDVNDLAILHIEGAKPCEGLNRSSWARAKISRRTTRSGHSDIPADGIQPMFRPVISEKRKPVRMCSLQKTVPCTGTSSRFSFFLGRNMGSSAGMSRYPDRVVPALRSFARYGAIGGVCAMQANVINPEPLPPAM